MHFGSLVVYCQRECSHELSAIIVLVNCYTRHCSLACGWSQRRDIYYMHVNLCPIWKLSKYEITMTSILRVSTYICMYSNYIFALEAFYFTQIYQSTTHTYISHEFYFNVTYILNLLAIFVYYLCQCPQHFQINVYLLCTLCHAIIIWLKFSSELSSKGPVFFFNPTLRKTILLKLTESTLTKKKKKICYNSALGTEYQNRQEFHSW